MPGDKVWDIDGIYRWDIYICIYRLVQASGTA